MRLLPGESRNAACSLVCDGKPVSDTTVLPWVGHIKGLDAPPAVYRSQADGKLWITLVNSADYALEFDKEETLFEMRQLSEDEFLTSNSVADKPEVLSSLSEEDRVLLSYFSTPEVNGRDEGDHASFTGEGGTYFGSNVFTAGMLEGCHSTVPRSTPRVRCSEPEVLPPLYHATFKQWLDNQNEPKFTIMSLHASVWDRDDVLPSVIFYSGMGGMSAGNLVKREGKYVITASPACCSLPKATRSAC